MGIFRADALPAPFGLAPFNAEMLDHAVGMDNIELAIGEFHIACIAGGKSLPPGLPASLLIVMRTGSCARPAELWEKPCGRLLHCTFQL